MPPDDRPEAGEERHAAGDDPSIRPTAMTHPAEPAVDKYVRRRRGGLASSPSASSTSTPTASSSPSRSRTTRARPCARQYASLDDFLSAWNEAERKQAIVEELREQGVFLDELRRAGRPRLRRLRPRLPRRLRPAAAHPPERADKVTKRNVFAKYGEQARAVLDALLDKYADEGIEQRRVARDPQGRPAHQPLARRSRSSSSSAARQSYLAAIRSSKHELYRAGRLSHGQRLQHRQDHPGHHAQGRRHRRRRAAPRASSAGCSSSRSSTTARRSWNSSATTTSRRCPSTCAGRNWAADAEGITGDALLDFVNNTCFPKLKELLTGGAATRSRASSAGVFEDANNYMKNGTLMRQVINKINGIDFNASDDRHMFGDIYEKILKDLQSAGNAGEFYTPRAVTQFIVEQVNPRLGETILDPACGTGGFLVCAIEHLRKQAKTAGRRAHHPGLLRRHREEAPAARAVHDQSDPARHRRARPTSATTTRSPARCATGARRSASTSSSPTRPSAAWRRTASRPTSPPSSAPARPPTSSSCSS